MQTFIFGHRSPDTDSVSSSIALSYLLNQLGENTVPKVLGNINAESKFVLDYFNVKCPNYLNDTKVQVEDIKYNKNVFIHEEDPISQAFHFMQEKALTALPLVDHDKKLTGLVTLKEIAKYLIKGDKEKIDTTYENIMSALDGTELLKFDDTICGKVMVASYQSQTLFEKVNLTHEDVLIVGDRYRVLDYAIRSKVQLIVITGDLDLTDDLFKKAKQNHVNVIVSKYNSFETTNKLILSNKVKSININTQPITVHDKDFRTDFISLANKVGHTNYPVINSKGKCLGLLKVTNSDDYVKQKVILVDHNGMSQSAVGIDEAEITQVIDHHNLSALGTNVPINFRSMPVGCTCTIIYNMYLENKIEIPSNIAGLMLSAILSDTLVFKSPTTTSMDKEAASELAKIAEVSIDQYGYQMFKAASSIAGIPISDLIKQDFKAFSVGNEQFAISQVMTMDFNEIEEHMDEYIEKLDEISSSYVCVVLFITDVYKNGSYVLYNRNAKDIIEEAFHVEEAYEGIYLDDFVSRKKQMLPPLLEVIEKRV